LNDGNQNSKSKHETLKTNNDIWSILNLKWFLKLLKNQL